MSRLSGLLLVALVASALMLVKSAYDTRRIFAEIHRAEAEGLRLAGEQRRLEAERQLQATNLRVESTARTKLQMRTMTPAVMLFENGTSAAPMPASAPAR